MAKKEDLSIGENGVLGGGLDALHNEMIKEYGCPIIKGTELQSSNLVSSGVFLIDYATYGGIPDSSPWMIHGVKSSGKTTVNLHYVAELQRKYPTKKVLYLAIERGAFDVSWAKACGVDLTRLLVIKDGNYGERYAAIVESAILTNELCGIIVDSAPKLLPENEMNRPADEEYRMGSNVRMVSLMINKYLNSTGKLNSIDIINNKKEKVIDIMIPSISFINQRREAIGGKYPTASLPCGQDLQHFCPLILELKRGKEPDKADSSISYHEFNLSGRLNRNKVNGTQLDNGAFEVSKSDLHPRVGRGTVDDYATVVTYANRYDIIGGGGASQTLAVYPDRKFAKQVDMAKALIEDNDKFRLLKACIIAKSRIAAGIAPFPPDGNLQGVDKSYIQEALDRA